MKTTYQASDGAAYEVFLGRWTRVLAGPFAEFARLPEEGATSSMSTAAPGASRSPWPSGAATELRGLTSPCPILRSQGPANLGRASISSSGMPAGCPSAMAASPLLWPSFR